MSNLLKASIIGSYRCLKKILFSQARRFGDEAKSDQITIFLIIIQPAVLQ